MYMCMCMLHMHMHISMGVLRAEDVVGCSIGPRRCTPGVVRGGRAAAGL